MKSVAKFIVHVAELVEAEGRAFRQSSVCVGLALAIALGAVLVGVGGLALMAWGIFEALKPAMNVIGAALISGVFLLVCSLGLVVIVLRLGRDGAPRP